MYQDKESYRLQDYQKQKRGKKLKSAMDLALKLRNLKLPEIDEKYISTKKIRSKFENEKKRLLDRIVKDIPNVISDPKSIEELHELRKSSKKLRYLLELLPKEEKAVSRLICRIN
jgi:CHAD domain-containing protein